MADGMKKEFEGVVSSDENGRIVINLSDLPADAELIIEGLNGRFVQFSEPAKEQTNKSDIINASVDKRAYNIGDVLLDGWVVGPRSPKTGIVMAIEPIRGALDGYKTWHQGQDHAAELREQGHANARQPSAYNNNDELNAIYNEVVKAGRNGNAKLSTSVTIPYGRYWSAPPDSEDQAKASVRVYNFHGHPGWHWDFKEQTAARVRCVRDEPDLTLAQDL